MPIVLLNLSLSLPFGGMRGRVENKVEEGEVEEEGEVIGSTVGLIVEAKWKFPAKLLRVNCNFFRKERTCLKKLEDGKEEE